MGKINVVITGGAGTIGSEIVRRFAISETNKVFVLDIKNKGCKDTDQIKYFNCNVCDLDSLNQLILSEEFPDKVDHLITVAGGGLQEEWTSISDIDMGVIRESVDLNLFGHINVIYSIYPLMKKSGKNKSITMISSINAKVGYGLPGYSAAKAGLEGFMYAIVSELAQSRIRINIISPGTVVTELTLREKNKDWSKLKKDCLLDSFTTAEDIASVAYMLSRNNSIVGQNIVVDSGQSIKR